MLLAYVHLNDNQQELCLVAEKADQFSKAVPIKSLASTAGGVCRLGPYEAVVVEGSLREGGIEVLPTKNSKIYITPSLPDLPGMQVVALRFTRDADGVMETQFQQDRERREGVWKSWKNSIAL